MAESNIKIGPGLLHALQEYLPRTDYEFYVVITEDTVKTLYAETVLNSLNKLEAEIHVLSFPAGEKNKNEATKQSLDHELLKRGCSRKTLILALGGGVVGDLAGFVASTYLRGVDYVQVPTTLLAMVDSSIGGKTGVNTSYGKNLIGSFWLPKSVIMSTETLATLPLDHLKNGLIEALKMFCTFSEKDWTWAEGNLSGILSYDEPILTELIQRAAAHKIRVTTEDFTEKGSRMLLNFGHTVGHALEFLSDYELLHGFAVGLGMIVEAEIARQRGLLQEEDFLRLRSLLSALQLDMKTLFQFSDKELWEVMQGDKKNKNFTPHLVLLEKIGKVHEEGQTYAHPLTLSELTSALNSLNSLP